LQSVTGRTEAERRRLRVTGTLGVLLDAHWSGLLDFERALAQLRQIDFYLSDRAIALARQELTSGEGKS
jgi:predicted nucleic acid-binding protein